MTDAFGMECVREGVSCVLSEMKKIYYSATATRFLRTECETVFSLRCVLHKQIVQPQRLFVCVCLRCFCIICLLVVCQTLTGQLTGSWIAVITAGCHGI